jgi:hypothetical protein
MSKEPMNTKVEAVVNAVSVSTPATEAEQIWNEIKDKEIHMFSLPSQRICDHCTPVMLEPSKCWLTFKASATLPALETAVGDKYECNVVKNYITVARKPVSLV